MIDGLSIHDKVELAGLATLTAIGMLFLFV
jgi:hypothetical protein